MKFLLLALLLSSPAAAQSLLHPMFADHAVLQRGQPIRIYGQVRPGTEVKVQMGNAAATTRAGAGGQWSADLPAMPAGGPYSLQVSGGGGRPQGSDGVGGGGFFCTGAAKIALRRRGAGQA